MITEYTTTNKSQKEFKIKLMEVEGNTSTRVQLYVDSAYIDTYENEKEARLAAGDRCEGNVKTISNDEPQALSNPNSQSSENDTIIEEADSSEQKSVVDDMMRFYNSL
tara:strand:- start:53 stop:376 length:324 start_codon:yes stop_codon:yes gene_type:complete